MASLAPTSSATATSAGLAASPTPSTSTTASSTSWFVESFRSSTSNSSVTGEPSLRLLPDEHYGRRVFIGNAVSAGSNLLSESAFIASLSPNQLDQRCAACWQLINQDSTKRCSACQIARYCSAQCQKVHWNRSHRLECTCLRPYRDRATDRHPAYLPTTWLTCQLVMWAIQRPLNALRRAAVDEMTKTTPTYQALDRTKLEQQELALKPFDEWYARFNQLEGHHQAETKQRYAEAAILVREVTLHICQTAAERELHAKLFPIDWYITTLARFSCNGFSVCDDELRPIGFSIFPTVSMVNHSCQPNAIAMFDVGTPGSGTRITIRAIRDIKSNEEINISYIGLAQFTSARKLTLRSQYFFECTCPRCTGSDESARFASLPSGSKMNDWMRNKFMEAFKCDHQWREDPKNEAPSSTTASTSSLSSSASRCTGILLSNPDSPPFPRCSSSTCGRLHNGLFLQSMVEQHVRPSMMAIEAIKRQLEKGDISKYSKPQLQIFSTTLQTSLLALNQIFNSVASPILIGLDQLILVTIELQDWPTALQTLTASLPLYQFYYSGLASHPLLGLQYLMHAKLAWLLEDATAALASWQRALTILRVTHGPNHPLVKQIERAIPGAQIESLQQPMKELAMQKKLKA